MTRLILAAAIAAAIVWPLASEAASPSIWDRIVAYIVGGGDMPFPVGPKK